MIETKEAPMDLQTVFSGRMDLISRAKRVALHGAGRNAEAVRDYCLREGKTVLHSTGNLVDHRYGLPVAGEGSGGSSEAELLFLVCDTREAIRDALDMIETSDGVRSVLCAGPEVLSEAFDREWLASAHQYYNLLSFLAEANPEPFLLGEFIRIVFLCAGVSARDGFYDPQLHDVVTAFLKSRNLDRLLDAATGLMESFRENDVPLSKPKGLFLSYIQAYKAHLARGERSVERRVPFFVFSTGHSGTAWMARFLSMISPGEMVCHHKKVAECFEKKANEEGVPSVSRFYGRLLLRYKDDQTLPPLERSLAAFLPEYVRFINAENAQNKMTGDCNGHMGPICEEIADAFPSAKAIHLVRNGILTVNSVYWTMRKLGVIPDYHAENEEYYLRFTGWTTHRALYPEFSPFVFACANWSLIHTLIMDVWGRWPDRFRTYRLEDLQIDYEQVRDLKLFLTETQSGEELSVAAWNLCTGFDINRHSGRKDPVEVWISWTPEQRKIFKDICGDAMARHGYAIPRIP